MEGRSVPGDDEAATLAPVAAGVAAAAGLGFLNRAAHESAWGPGLMCAAAGLLGAWTAVRAASAGRGPRGAAWSAAATATALGALLLTATYLDSRKLWEGGAWLAAAAAGTALAMDVAAAARGNDLRGPAAACLAALGAGVVLVRFSAWGAAIGAAAALPALVVLLEGRIRPGSGAPEGRTVEVVHD